MSSSRSRIDVVRSADESTEPHSAPVVSRRSDTSRGSRGSLQSIRLRERQSVEQSQRLYHVQRFQYAVADVPADAGWESGADFGFALQPVGEFEWPRAAAGRSIWQ